MTQEAANELLSDYLDGELTDAEVAELEHRLARDPALQQELDQLRAAVDLLRTHGPVQAPPSLYASIMEAVDEEPMPGGFWRWLQRPFGIPLQTLAVVVVAILVIGVSVGGVLTVGGLDLADSREIVPTTAVSKSDDTKGDAVADAAPEEAEEQAAGGEAKQPASVASRTPTTGSGDTERLAKGGEADEPVADLTTPPTVDVTTGSSAKSIQDLVGYDGANTQNAMPMGTGDGGVTEGTSTSTRRKSKRSGSSDKSGEFFARDSSLHMLSLRPQDLETVARIYGRYAGKKRSARVTKAIMNATSDSTETITFLLPDPASRNAFIDELRRSFPAGAYAERTKSDDNFTVDSAQVTLSLTVMGIAPSGKADASKIQTLRGSETTDEAYEADQAEPASTEPSGK